VVSAPTLPSLVAVFNEPLGPAVRTRQHHNIQRRRIGGICLRMAGLNFLCVTHGSLSMDSEVISEQPFPSFRGTSCRKKKARDTGLFQVQL
jgi:hypothetical protein